MDVTTELCEAIADELMALAEPDRLRRIWALGEQALAGEAPALPIRVGLVLRGRGVIDWAEYVFALAMKIPNARAGALFELAVAAALTGRPQEAVLLLHRLEAEEPLNAYHQRTFAYQLNRLGDREGALARLEMAQALDPVPPEDNEAVRQFFDYWLTFPPAEGLRRSRDLLALHPLLTTEEVAAEISGALETGRPYALVRLNDGEGAVLRLSDADEAAYGTLYRRNRWEFHVLVWFGDESLMDDPDFLQACDALNAALPRFDCAAADHRAGLARQYDLASARGVPSLLNVVRKLEGLGTAPEGHRIGICQPDIAYALLFEGRLERLIRSRPRLGLVSGDLALRAGLQQRFGLSEVVFHHADPAEAFEPRHARLSAELAAAEPGLLYLVTELGIAGKVYCDLIKSAGGVALDVGGAIDLWRGAGAA